MRETKKNTLYDVVNYIKKTVLLTAPAYALFYLVDTNMAILQLFYLAPPKLAARKSSSQARNELPQPKKP
jgi:hypothetical protein